MIKTIPVTRTINKALFVGDSHEAPRMQWIDSEEAEGKEGEEMLLSIKTDISFYIRAKGSEMKATVHAYHTHADGNILCKIGKEKKIQIFLAGGVNPAPRTGIAIVEAFLITEEKKKKEELIPTIPVVEEKIKGIEEVTMNFIKEDEEVLEGYVPQESTVKAIKKAAERAKEDAKKRIKEESKKEDLVPTAPIVEEEEK